jgi:tRNA A37 threonylcarbamoyladenosine modification protein TsaB
MVAKTPQQRVAIALLAAVRLALAASFPIFAKSALAALAEAWQAEQVIWVDAA